MAALGNDVPENALELYLAVKTAHNIVCVEVNRTRVILRLSLDPDTVELSDIVIGDRENAIGAQATWSAACALWRSSRT